MAPGSSSTTRWKWKTPLFAFIVIFTNAFGNFFIARGMREIPSVGAPADLIRFDPDEPYVVDPSKLHSRSKNTPFEAAHLQGRVKLTLVAGRIVHD